MFTLTGTPLTGAVTRQKSQDSSARLSAGPPERSAPAPPHTRILQWVFGVGRVSCSAGTGLALQSLRPGRGRAA